MCRWFSHLWVNYGMKYVLKLECEHAWAWVVLPQLLMSPPTHSAMEQGVSPLIYVNTMCTPPVPLILEIALHIFRRILGTAHCVQSLKAFILPTKSIRGPKRWRCLGFSHRTAIWSPALIWDSHIWMYLLRRNPNLNIALKTGALGVRHC